MPLVLSLILSSDAAASGSADRGFDAWGVGARAAVGYPGALDLQVSPWYGRYAARMASGTSFGISASVSLPLRAAPPTLLLDADACAFELAFGALAFAQVRLALEAPTAPGLRAGVGAFIGLDRLGHVELRVGGGVDAGERARGAFLLQVGVVAGAPVRARGRQAMK